MAISATQKARKEHKRLLKASCDRYMENADSHTCLDLGDPARGGGCGPCRAKYAEQNKSK